jgi:hypothetical protein
MEFRRMVYRQARKLFDVDREGIVRSISCSILLSDSTKTKQWQCHLHLTGLLKPSSSFVCRKDDKSDFWGAKNNKSQSFRLGFVNRGKDTEVLHLFA